jgi:hypothetical protein
MPTPFGAETWVQRASIPNIPLNGVYSGLVQGPIHAVYDPESRVIQSFSKVAHHFQGFASTAQISFDDGATWAISFQEPPGVGIGAGLGNKVVFQGWSLAGPEGFGRIHFQVRWDLTKAFIGTDGTLQPGGIGLFVSEGGANFYKLQDFHTWPGINQIGGDGGAVQINTFPSCTTPIFIAGSGPDGVDAHWLVTSYSFDAGGASNRQTLKAVTLWRSINGGIEWEAVRDMEPVTGMQAYQQLVVSPQSGRLFLVAGAGGSIQYTDDLDDLTTATWHTSVFSGPAGVRGTLEPMFGGTFFTFSQGTLTGPGGSWVSCDDGENFQPGGDDVVPQNQTGFMKKLGPTEALLVAPGFANPTTETASYYTSDGGETFLVSDPWIVSIIGESPVMVAIRSNGTPIVVTRAGNVYVSSSVAKGVADLRIICPLANAGLARARRLLLCGGVITPDCQE